MENLLQIQTFDIHVPEGIGASNFGFAFTWSFLKVFTQTRCPLFLHKKRSFARMTFWKSNSTFLFVAMFFFSLFCESCFFERKGENIPPVLSERLRNCCRKEFSLWRTNIRKKKASTNDYYKPYPTTRINADFESSPFHSPYVFGELNDSKKLLKWSKMRFCFFHLSPCVFSPLFHGIYASFSLSWQRTKFSC